MLRFSFPRLLAAPSWGGSRQQVVCSLAGQASSRSAWRLTDLIWQNGGFKTDASPHLSGRGPGVKAVQRLGSMQHITVWMFRSPHSQFPLNTSTELTEARMTLILAFA